MKRQFFLLTLLCTVLFGTFTIAAFAASPDDSPSPSSDRNFSRKSGDMAVYWYGGGYSRSSAASRSKRRSGRLGSVGNRSYQGGGLRGGK